MKKKVIQSGHVSSGRVHVVEPASASEIRKTLGISERRQRKMIRVIEQLRHEGKIKLA